MKECQQPSHSPQLGRRLESLCYQFSKSFSEQLAGRKILGFLPTKFSVLITRVFYWQLTTDYYL
jgi:hypothetical protein